MPKKLDPQRAVGMMVVMVTLFFYVLGGFVWSDNFPMDMCTQGFPAEHYILAVIIVLHLVCH